VPNEERGKPASAGLFLNDNGEVLLLSFAHQHNRCLRPRFRSAHGLRKVRGFIDRAAVEFRDDIPLLDPGRIRGALLDDISHIGPVSALKILVFHQILGQILDGDSQPAAFDNRCLGDGSRKKRSGNGKNHECQPDKQKQSFHTPSGEICFSDFCETLDEGP